MWVWIAVIVALLVLINRLSPLIYDIVIVKMTALWYRSVLDRLPRGARVLDIGIGTGSALAANADTGAAVGENCVVIRSSAGRHGCVMIRRSAKCVGVCLLVCAATVRDKDLQWVGVDYDRVYVDACKKKYCNSKSHPLGAYRVVGCIAAH